MDWVPILFISFKVTAFVLCMFFAIKWHYDQGRKENEISTRAVLLACAKAAAIFVPSLLALLLFTFMLCRKLGLDLNLPAGQM